MVVIIFAYGGVRVAEGSLTVGTLISFLIYLFQLLNPVSNIASFFSGKAKAEGALNYLKELTAVTPENPTGDKASSGELALSHLSFSYDQEIILDDISMTFPQGKKIALVGPSGAGKSTIVHLLERFYPLSTGTLTLNKKDSRLIALKDWREKFALVSQDNQLLAGTIAENLQLGLPVPASDDQLFAALKVAYLEKEVKALPDGLQTIIGENGVKLSGGQKQRLQLARAYLRKPEFLILDEATANLDSDSEQYIQKSLASVMVGKTTIAIAHRLATIIDADIIYFLENHHVTGQGTHQELLSTHPSYARFVKEQFLD